MMSLHILFVVFVFFRGQFQKEGSVCLFFQNRRWLEAVGGNGGLTRRRRDAEDGNGMTAGGCSRKGTQRAQRMISLRILFVVLVFFRGQFQKEGSVCLFFQNRR
jgi:hypothetical protein